jgi:hypothetical protein
VKVQESFISVFNFEKNELENDYISEEIYNDFMNNEIVLYSKRKTGLDIWVSHLAYIFDFNFISGLKYIYENNYIDKIVNKLEVKNSDTKIQIENIRKHADNYLKEKIK